MAKEIYKALAIAFLLYLIPLVYNQVSGGALIQLLGGVTQAEKQDLAARINSLEAKTRLLTSTADGRGAAFVISPDRGFYLQENGDVTVRDRYNNVLWKTGTDMH